MELIAGALTGVITGIALWLTIWHERRSARTAATSETARRVMLALEDLINWYDDPRPGLMLELHMASEPDLSTFPEVWRRTHVQLALFEAQLRRDWPHLAEVVQMNGKALKSRVGFGASDPLAARHIVVSEAELLQRWVVEWIADPEKTNRGISRRIRRFRERRAARRRRS